VHAEASQNQAPGKTEPRFRFETAQSKAACVARCLGIAVVALALLLRMNPLLSLLTRLNPFAKAPAPSEQKAASVFNQMWGSGNDGPSARELTTPLKDSVWLFAGCKMITSQLNRVELQWYLDDKRNDQAGEDPLRDSFWKYPATRCAEKMQRSDAVEAIGTWMLLSGEANVILGDDWLVPRRGVNPSPFMIAKPNRLRPINARDGELVGWEYNDGIGYRFTLLPQQVIRSVMFNPYDDQRGLGPYEPASVETAADVYAGNFARNMAASNGQQSTYIVTDGAQPTKEQQDQIIAQLRAKQRQIERGNFSPVFLPGGLRVEDPHARAVDSAFIHQRIEHRHAIAAALGIPMSMFDVTVAYSIGAASDLYRLITFTCEPFGLRIAELLSRIEAARTGTELFAGFRWGEHPVLQQARMERMTVATQLFQSGVPWSVIDDTLKLEMEEFPGWDTAWIDFGKQPVDDALDRGSGELDDPAAIAPPAEGEGEDPFAEARQIFATRIAEKSQDGEAVSREAHNLQSRVQLPLLQPTPVQTAGNRVQTARTVPVIPQTHPGDENAGNRPTAIQLGARTKASRSRLRLWESHMAAQKPYVRRLHSAFGKVLAKYRRKLLDELPQAMPQRNVGPTTCRPVSEGETKGVIDFIFDLSDFTTEMLGAFRGTVPRTLTDAGKAAMQELGASGDFKPEPDWVRSYMAIRENKIKEASEAAYTRIKANLQEGIDTGDTMDELTDRVKDAFKQADSGQARVIAQTETASAFGVARQASQEQAGITHKEWVSAQDGRVRDTHDAADGQIVAIDEPFIVNGVEMMHPLADGAPASEVINCRCISVGSIKFNEDDV
jgi:SPP1 gp7 family putative phage head morphogenesis protein